MSRGLFRRPRSQGVDVRRFPLFDPWRMDRPLSVTSCVGSGWMGQSRHAREITHGTLATVSRRHQGSSVDVRRFPSDPLCYTLYMGWRSGAQIHVSNLGASGCNSYIPGVNPQGVPNPTQVLLCASRFSKRIGPRTLREKYFWIC